jgi:hypothetical protein
VLMVQDDLAALVALAEAAGYQAKKIMGGPALILPGQHLEEAVHILFVGKKPRSSYPVPNPPIRPEEKQIYGIAVPVAPVEDLVLMKLNSLRDKDKVQLQILDQTGLITDDIDDLRGGRRGARPRRLPARGSRSLRPGRRDAGYR